MTIVSQVCGRIVGNPRFISDYRAITTQSILQNANLGSFAPLEEDVIQRLLQSAALLAQSSDEEWRLMAYRITVGALAYGGILGGVPETARLILARLGNYPAIGFAFGDKKEPSTLPPSVFYEIVGRRDDNTVGIGDRFAVLTNMQKAVWDAISAGGSLALSAPTSAGKSYVFLSYIEHLKHDIPGSRIIYLVPTRALITQVANDLRENADQSFGVATVPIVMGSEAAVSPVYVLTPERLQVLFHTALDLTFDVAIVDEAHLIGDGSRGVVLHRVLHELQRRNPKAQFLFSSPQVRDPGVFGSVVGSDGVKVIKTTDTAVAQNILLLKGDAIETRRIRVFLWERGQQTALAEIETGIPLYNSADRLVYLGWMLGATSQSLIYAEGPAACEEIALKIKDLRDSSREAPDGKPVGDAAAKARSELSAFAKESVHSTYVLADTVGSGVGFHYGRIPALLRNAVEEAFAAGVLDYIVCTSTLLQGVNLPARNIFMQNPYKGPEKPIDPVDFWNLAGRAGRLGKDFQGNVFLIDYEEWESAPLSGPRDEPVKPSLESTVIESSADLLEFVGAQDRPTGQQPLLEAAFAKLLSDYKHGRLSEALNRMVGISPARRAEIEEAIKGADSQITVRVETLDATPQLSGYRQQGLYDYMVKKIKEKGPAYLIPLHPSSDWNEALNKLRPVFARVHRYLELQPGNHHRYWAPLALRWMRGDPLPRIIDSAIQYHSAQGRKRSNRTVIREVLTEVESDLRFRYVNLLGCYTAVLKQALLDTGHPSFISSIPALTLYLELGAASQTMVQLISLGLSRHTASVVANLSVNRDMDAAAARAFIARLNPEATGLSSFLTRELTRIRAAL